MTERAELITSTRLIASVAAFGASVALAVAAAHWYDPPHLSGAPELPMWLERDVLCAIASSAIALAMGAATRRWATRPGAIASGSVLLRGALWGLLSVLLLALWAHQLFLLSLLVAPSQAFAALRLFALLSSWRSELR